MSDIFISYASVDREKARTIAEVLGKKGWSVWWDRRIPPGKTFAQIIKEALDVTKCIVVLWSSESVESDWVQNEAAEGARRKILVPALIEDVEIPFEFRRIQAACLVDWDPVSPHTEFEEFVGSIGTMIGYPTTSENVEKAIDAHIKVDHQIPQEIHEIPAGKKAPSLGHNTSFRWIATIITFVISVSAGYGAGFLVAEGLGGGNTAGWVAAIPTWLAGLVITFKIWRRYSKV